MAAEGIRFTHFYPGATVCAPSRSVLMTGQQTGHTHVRGNAARTAQSLRDEDVTVAEVLKSAGYATGLFGKWGLGEVDMEGHPLKQGFDSFFGYPPRFTTSSRSTSGFPSTRSRSAWCRRSLWRVIANRQHSSPRSMR